MCNITRVYQQCTNCQKQSNSKKWSLVYQSSHVYTESVEYTKSTSASASTSTTFAEYTKPFNVPTFYYSTRQEDSRDTSRLEKPTLCLVYYDYVMAVACRDCSAGMVLLVRNMPPKRHRKIFCQP